MTHPPRVDADDPHLPRVRQLCLALPEAREKPSHGIPTFYVTKVFAMYSAVVKGAHHDDRWKQSIVIKPDPAEAQALARDERFFVPAYYGPLGWLGLDLRAAEPDWTEIAELIDMSYRMTAPKHLVGLLGEPG